MLISRQMHFTKENFMQNCNNSDCCTPSTKSRNIISVLLSIPWCCVISLGIAFFTTTGSLLGFIFDDLMHKVIPFLVLFHIYGITSYARHKEKTRGRTLFLIFTTILFVVSIGFHFTDLHDKIIGH